MLKNVLGKWGAQRLLFWDYEKTENICKRNPMKNHVHHEKLENGNK